VVAARVITRAVCLILGLKRPEDFKQLVMSFLAD
jgi:hypothetical protein